MKYKIYNMIKAIKSFIRNMAKIAASKWLLYTPTVFKQTFLQTSLPAFSKHLKETNIFLLKI